MLYLHMDQQNLSFLRRVLARCELSIWSAEKYLLMEPHGPCMHTHATSEPPWYAVSDLYPKAVNAGKGYSGLGRLQQSSMWLRTEALM